jgi:H2-forming N5,N10-methylenetetrahydromethanopterin dehydrogenase-like enzyme
MRQGKRAMVVLLNDTSFIEDFGYVHQLTSDILTNVLAQYVVRATRVRAPVQVIPQQEVYRIALVFFLQQLS